jgi:hypothetical protein
MAGPPELAEIFITAAFRSIHSPRAAIRFGRLDSGFPTPAHTPEQGGQAARGKRPAASHARAALAPDVVRPPVQPDGRFARRLVRPGRVVWPGRRCSPAAVSPGRRIARPSGVASRLVWPGRLV